MDLHAPDRKTDVHRRIAIACLLLAGCAAPPAEHPATGWTHPTATAADFERDRARCVFEAERATAGFSLAYVPPTAYGAIWAREQETDVVHRRIRVLQACMAAHGYTHR